MKKLLFSIVTALLMTVFMMGTVFAEAGPATNKLEATIEITANKTSVVEGDEVEFTFTIKDLKNAKDDSIAAIEGKVEYNTDFFEFVSSTFSVGGASGEAFNVAKVGKEGDVYAKLVLKVKDDAKGTGSVKFTDLKASDGDTSRPVEDSEASTNPISFSYQIVNPITPPTNVTGVKINAAVTKIKVGGTVLLVPSFTPANPVNKNVTWSSSDNEVAVVYDNGLVKGRKEGTAIITVTTEDGYKTASIEITVVKNNEITGDNDDNKDDSNNDSNNGSNNDGQKKDELVIEDDKNKQDEVKNDNVNGDKKDATVANTDLPKAGLSITFFVVIAAAIISAIVIYKKNQNFKDIK